MKTFPHHGVGNSSAAPVEGLPGRSTLEGVPSPTRTERTQSTEDGEMGPERTAELEPERVADLLAANGAQVVDVRTPTEHGAGHVAGARHLPLDRVADEADRLDRSTPVIFYCRSGERSATARDAFRASGWEAYTMRGGLVAWRERGLPLEPEGGEVAPRSKLPGAGS